MTYAAYDTSIQDGRAVELYEFVQGATTTRYTSRSTDYSYGGHTWAHETLGHTPIRQSSEMNQDAVEVRFPRDSVFAQQFTSGILESVTTFTLRRGHQDDPDQEFMIEWIGRVIGGAYDGPAIVLTCESIYTSQRRRGLKLRYQRTCTYVLYGPGCNVVKEDFAVPGVIGSLSGTLMTVPEAAAQADGWFRGGMAEAADGSLRYLLNHVGATLTLSRPHPDLATLVSGAGWDQAWDQYWDGIPITLYPGCDLQDTTCAVKFNNLANALIFRNIPEKNPMGGSSIV